MDGYCARHGASGDDLHGDLCSVGDMGGKGEEVIDLHLFLGQFS